MLYFGHLTDIHFYFSEKHTQYLHTPLVFQSTHAVPRKMPKQRPSGFIYAKWLPGGGNVWQYNNSNDQVFCKACSVGFSYQAANLKYRIDSHYNTGKHEKQALQRNRQQTLVSNAATENEFEKELTRIFVMENIPLAKVGGKVLETNEFFSKMSALLTPQRLRLTFEALKFHLMINWNCSEDFHNE